MRAFLMVPYARNVSDEGKPDIAWRLMWGGLKSDASSGSLIFSSESGLGALVPSSPESWAESSTTKSNTHPLQWWLELHLSSQL